MASLGYELRLCMSGKGYGVFANSRFEPGDTVIDGVVGRPVDRNDVHANQVGPTQWVREGGMHEKLNHSCDPSCGVRVNASGSVDYVARRRIDVGDEISFDYAMRNYVVEHVPAQCLCGSTEESRNRYRGCRHCGQQRQRARTKTDATTNAAAKRPSAGARAPRSHRPVPPRPKLR